MKRRLFALLAAVCLLAGLFPRASAETAIDLSALTCEDFLSSEVHSRYMDLMMTHYIQSDSRLSDALLGGKSVVFLFEGGSDHYPENAYEDDTSDIRNQAVVLVVQLGADGKAAIVTHGENCSTLPGDPRFAIQIDGTYPIYTWNHQNKYGAIQIDQQGMASCLYAPDSDPNGYFGTGIGINIHTRSSDRAGGTSSSGNTWYWSEGCMVVGTGGDSGNYFNEFLRAVAGIDYDVWIDYSAKTFRTIPANEDAGFLVIDRQLAKDGLRELYNPVALGKITAASDAARAAAEATTPAGRYLSRCIPYPSHSAIVTSAPALVWNMPSRDGEVLAATTTGEVLTSTGIFQNPEGEYWYRVVHEGEPRYLFGGDADFDHPLTSGLAVSGVVAPVSITQGKSFVIGGVITSDHASLATVTAQIRNADSGSVSLTATANVSGGSFSLKGSQIDKALTFGKLAAGTYLYSIHAEAVSYHTTDGANLRETAVSRELYSTVFTVVPSHTCDRSTDLGYAQPHPHARQYQCAVCGKVQTDPADHRAVSTCPDCRPGKAVPEIRVDGETTFTWADSANTTHYDLSLWCRAADGSWVCMEEVFHAKSGLSRTLPQGVYRVQIRSWNAHLPEPDGTQPVSTLSGWVFFAIRPDPGGELHQGIDVSHHQGVIDWDAVAPTIDFAILRCGYGSDLASQDDRQWTANADACTRLGIPFGVYLYSYARTEEQALSEANHVLRLLEGYSPALPVYLDQEDASISSNCSREEILRHAEIFCETIRAAGYQVGIYANYNWWTTYLTDSAYEQWPRWIARYASATGYGGDYQMWQYTSTGTVPGINSQVDQNYWYGPLPDGRSVSIELSEPDFPAEFFAGSAPAMGGTITASAPISWVSVQIDVPDSRAHLQQAVRTPESHTCDLSDLFAGLELHALAPGAYTCRISAVSGGEYFVLLETGFTVREKPQNPFTDVPEDSFYYEPVLWAVAGGITNGTSPTTFGPSEPCMRAQVVTFLWRAMGSPEPGATENPFVDVCPTDFYYKSVLWALEQGITAGMDATHFGPTVSCNRAQVVTFLYRTMGSPEIETANNPFVDVERGGFYEKAVLWAVEQGITNGLSTTAFGPSNLCNRAQIVTFLYRAF